jgi:voltage-gated potassium channel
MLRAGANRAVNPQLIGGRRMAAFALQPDVAEFLDVVMHDESPEFRMEQVLVAAGSPVSGRTVREADLAAATGILLLAIRSGPAVAFLANPAPDTPLARQSILIAVGTPAQLDALHRCCTAT